jgi:hypothetical protein
LRQENQASIGRKILRQENLMPVRTPDGLTGLREESFTQAAYEVVATAFAVHTKFGGMFDERIYKTEVGAHLPTLNFPAKVRFPFPIEL